MAFTQLKATGLICLLAIAQCFAIDTRIDLSRAAFINPAPIGSASGSRALSRTASPQGIGSPLLAPLLGLDGSDASATALSMADDAPPGSRASVDLNRTSFFWGVLLILILSVLFSSYFFN
ncbi:unnamed protein product [Vitrella brassicaformis CCMP3155]|uniref:PSII-L n=1 Tax=Vitrella brassicaformis (strain CCMP3155) TaxID=1169540 RepID=A0A0G4EHL9_VITBC|nr:unnamed protein product [Vitrella brassicaformis CCMP3155]|mmetsp:Transcript_32792/g.94666  ORF Transcript_32792/g.94666 Transcript_32792/m.94666 type:complete len:121 (+) Transcript_32792:72-434(+)|eukprot:CEL95478.1 unnamed protein product [Vitrella brassicaformis CCMP3155]